MKGNSEVIHDLTASSTSIQMPSPSRPFSCRGKGVAKKKKTAGNVSNLNSSDS
jgi:hypothetical protein